MLELATLTPIIIGLVQVAKNLGLPSKYAPIVAVVLGGGLSFMWGYSPDNLITGIIAGLAASGLYTGSKAILSK